MTARAKPPVMFIHGAFCGPWAFENLQSRFAEAGYAVVAPVLRFHDEKTAPEALASTGLADYAADLEDEIAALDGAPILVGHAMGGLLAPMAPWGVPPATLFEIAAAQALLLGGARRAPVEPRRDAGLAQALSRLSADTRERVVERLVAESGRALFESLHWGLDINRGSEVEPAKVTCPLLLLAGSEDRINPPGTVARIAALYKDRATCETVPGMGHWLQGEPGWEKVADRVLGWLKTLSA